MNSEDTILVYFSGTGGTQKIAQSMKKALQNHGHESVLHSLDFSVNESLKIDTEKLERSKYLIVLYPVYSFDAPKPVFEWIDTLPKQMNQKLTAVISVSGGGDIIVNRSCRVSCIHELINKGCNVIYEDMMVMPSNFAMKANDDLNMWLIKFIPNKVEKIVQQILLRKDRPLEKIKHKKKLSFGQKEHNHIKKFGTSLFTTDKCIACGWCADNCPRCNIEIVSGKPIFDDRCVMCMRCIYGCPTKAITSDKYKFVILKEGYNLTKMENEMKDRQLKEIDDCGKGILWIGAKRYLKQD